MGKVHTMKKKDKTVILYYISNLLFYIAAIINYVGGSEHRNAIICICLGSLMLCLGAAGTNKNKKDSE